MNNRTRFLIFRIAIDRRTAELVGLDEERLEKWTRLELTGCSERIECPKKVQFIESV